MYMIYKNTSSRKQSDIIMGARSIDLPPPLKRFKKEFKIKYAMLKRTQNQHLNENYY